MNLPKSVEYWPGTSELTKPAKAVAKILSVHHNTLFRWVKSGKIECVRFGRKSVHFTYDQVIRFLDQNREQIKLKI